MTPKALLSEKYTFSSVNNTCSDLTHFEEYSSSLQLETYLQALARAETFLPTFDEVEPGARPHEQRRRGLQHVLKRLSAMHLAGKEHVEEYLRDQHRRNCRPNTLRNSLITIESFLLFVKQRGREHLEQISREDLEAYIEHGQDRGLKASTVNMRLRTLKAFIRFLIERDTVRSEVLSKRLFVKVPNSLPKAMDPDDESKLLDVVKDIRDRAMVLVLLRTGMRIGELLGTLVSEVNLKERKIEIYEAEKTQIGRVVYVSDDAISALKAWLRKRQSKYEYLFYGRGGRPLSYGAARKRFELCLEKAGLSHKGYTLHALRHTFATEVLNARMRLDCLQQLLGHSSVEMTKRYARLTDKTREEEYFRAMAIIERGEVDGHNRFHRQLPTTPQEAQLLSSHDQELHEYP
jgi:integrase/recombinase XerD